MQRVTHRAEGVPLPDGLICPLSQDLFIDPVVTEDGHSYCRECILDWFEEQDRRSGTSGQQSISPVTKLPINRYNLTPNVSLRKAVSAYQNFIDTQRKGLTGPSGPDLKTEIARLRGELQRKETELVSARSEAVRAQIEVDALERRPRAESIPGPSLGNQREMSRLQSEIDQLQRELRARQTEVNKLKSHLLDAGSTEIAMRQKETEMKAITEENARLSVAVEEQEKDLKIVENELALLRTEKHREIQSSNAEVEHTKMMMERKDIEARRHREKSLELQEIITRGEKERTRIEKELENVRNECRKKDTELLRIGFNPENSSSVELKAGFQNLQDMLKISDSQGASSVLNGLQAEAGKIDAELDRLRVSVARNETEVEFKNKELQRITATMDRKDEELLASESELMSLQMKINRLEDELGSQVGKLSKEMFTKEQVDRMRAEWSAEAASQARRAAEATQLAEAKKAQEMFKAVQPGGTKNDNLQMQFEKQIADITQELRAARKDADERRQELEQVRSQMRVLESDIRRERAKTAQMQVEMEEIEQHALKVKTECDIELEAASKDAQEKTKTIRLREQESSQAKLEATRLEGVTRGLKQELDVLRPLANISQGELDKIKEKDMKVRNEQGDQVWKLKAEVEKSAIALTDAISDLKKAQKQRDEAEGLATIARLDLERQAEESQKRIQQLQSEMQKALRKSKADIEQLHKELKEKDDHLNAREGGVDEELVHLRGKLQAKERAAAKMTSTRQELDEANEEVRRLTTELASIENELAQSREAARAAKLKSLSPQFLTTSVAKAASKAANPRAVGKLVDAASGGNVQLLKELCENGADINDPNSEGVTALQAAVSKGQLEAVKWICSRGARVDIRNPKSGMTAVFLAAMNGKTEILRRLAAAGADKDMPDNEGRTPLHVAASLGHTDIVRVLRTMGADLNRTDNNGVPPLVTAAFHGRFAVVELLCNDGADKQATDKQGWTPLYAAAHSGQVEVVRFLLREKADPSSKAKDGTDALTIARKQNRQDVVAVLQGA